MNKLLNTCLVIILLGISAQGYSQELDLFQAVDSPEGNDSNSRRPQRAERSSSVPAFTLVGTSRFGNKYLASLKSRDGNSIVMEWNEGSVNEIKGYSGYGLANVNGRSVSIRLPEDESCIPSEENGVGCTGNIAVLTLSNAQPLEQQNEPVAAQNETNNSQSTSEVEQEENTEVEGETRTITNPFTGETQELPALTAEEQAAREARRARRTEQFRDFEIVRIADDEIPEGMQRIRTPFGDRLEPAEE